MKFAALGVAWIAWGCGSGNTAASDDAETEEEIVEQNLLYGIPADDYRIEHGEIAPGETMGRILNRYGVGAATVDRLDRAAKTDFPLDGIRAGNPYTVFIHEDSLNTPHLDYLVYERNASQYVVFGLHSVDSVSVTLGEKPVSVRRQKKQATIDSSLWGAIMREQMPYALAAELEEIYQWSIDFFGIQKGDAFTVVYDERIIDTTAVGIGRVWGAKFTHAGKDYYAIPFRQNNRIQYWDVSGGSLRKQLLKAPLKYSRISSRFSNARLHPIYKVYRPHHGVDYAAPKGTPVRAVADGVVTFKGWGGGGGNTLKIKHPGNMMSGYLHLSRFAKGIAQGSRVSQGQLIGYVGSTGASTAPRFPALAQRQADRSAQSALRACRTHRGAEPCGLRVRARPHRGRTRRRSERLAAHHATRLHSHRAMSARQQQPTEVDERIARFLGRHHVLTLATAADGTPYCANAFYAYDKGRNRLVFTSDLSTRHAREMLAERRVAASVVLETRIVGKVQGLQLCGTVARGDEEDKRRYLHRFPYAALAELTLWALVPDYLKFTDNTLGFGKKLIWKA